jgi:citrate synthase
MSCMPIMADASTFSARVTGATLSDIYSAIPSAIGTLRDPLHGANEGDPCLEIGSEDKWTLGWKSSSRKKGMGIGHRVYKVLDPRAPTFARWPSTFRRTGRAQMDRIASGSPRA